MAFKMRTTTSLSKRVPASRKKHYKLSEQRVEVYTKDFTKQDVCPSGSPLLAFVPSEDLCSPCQLLCIRLHDIGKRLLLQFTGTTRVSYPSARSDCLNDIPGYSDLAVLKDPVNFEIAQNWWISLQAAGKSNFNWVGLHHDDSKYWGSYGWYWVDGTPMSGDDVWPGFRDWSLIGGGWPDYPREAALWYNGYQPGLVTYDELGGSATAFCGVPSNILIV
jgi:hypothetical protein